jgi:hypothetical protein
LFQRSGDVIQGILIGLQILFVVREQEPSLPGLGVFEDGKKSRGGFQNVAGMERLRAGVPEYQPILV